MLDVYWLCCDYDKVTGHTEMCLLLTYSIDM